MRMYPVDIDVRPCLVLGHMRCQLLYRLVCLLGGCYCAVDPGTVTGTTMGGECMSRMFGDSLQPLDCFSCAACH
jgi:hypothetical protein